MGLQILISAYGGPGPEEAPVTGHLRGLVDWPRRVGPGEVLARDAEVFEATREALVFADLPGSRENLDDQAAVFERPPPDQVVVTLPFRVNEMAEPVLPVFAASKVGHEVEC